MEREESGPDEYQMRMAAELAGMRRRGERESARGRRKEGATASRKRFARDLDDNLHKMSHIRGWIALGRFLGPLLLAAAYIYSITLLYPDNFATVYTFMATFAFTPAGKFTASAMAPMFGTWQSALLLGTIDMLTGLFLIYNYDLTHKIPGVGRQLIKIEKKGATELQKRNWIRNVAFFGVVVFVAFPFYGTGSIGGSVVARIIGMKRWRAFLAVLVGAYGGTAVMAIFGASVAQAFRTNLALGVGVSIAVVGILTAAALLWRRSRIKKRATEPSAEPGLAHDADGKTCGDAPAQPFEQPAGK